MEVSILQKRMANTDDTFQTATNRSKSITNAIVDCGASHSCLNSFRDVDPTTIRRLKTPVQVGGIVGGLEVNYMAVAEWETLDQHGNVVPLKEKVLIHPDIPHPLLSPQAFLAFNNSGRRHGKLEDHFRIFHDRAEWHVSGSKLLTMDYDRSFLPRLVLFSKGTAVPSLEAMSSVLHSENRNLSPLRTIWMQWHVKLGHLSFSHVQKLALGGFLDKMALGLLRSATEAPHCAAC